MLIAVKHLIVGARLDCMRNITTPYNCAILRFSKVKKICHPNQSPDGKWTRKPLAYRESNIVHLRVTRPPEICVNLVLNIFTLLAVTQSVDNLFNSFIFLCENEYFLISNLH